MMDLEAIQTWAAEVVQVTGVAADFWITTTIICHETPLASTDWLLVFLGSLFTFQPQNYTN